MRSTHTTTIDRRAAYSANCALALKHVARCLPAEDRCHFFEGKGDYDEGVDIERMGKNDRDKEASPWLDVENLRYAAAAADDADVRGGIQPGKIDWTSLWNAVDSYCRRRESSMIGTSTTRPGNIFASGRCCEFWTRPRSSDTQSAMT